LLGNLGIVANVMQGNVKDIARTQPAAQSEFVAQSGLLIANKIDCFCIRKNPHEQSVSTGKRLGGFEKGKLLVHYGDSKSKMLRRIPWQDLRACAEVRAEVCDAH